MTLSEGITHCGDCLELMKQLPDKSVDLVLTDPPYGLDRGSFFAKRMRGIPERSIEWDKSIPCNDVFAELKRVAPHQIIWGANYMNCFSGLMGAIVWDKIQPLDNLSQCEIASCSYTKKIHLYTERWTNYVNTKCTDHETEKSVELIVWCIKRFTKPNDLILDPFMGSGTTGVAAIQTGRRFIGIEISPEYCKLANERCEAARKGLKLSEYRDGQQVLF